MRPVRHSLIRKQREKASSEYADAAGRSTQARAVKSHIYGLHKAAVDAGRTASAPALPERTGGEAGQARLVPQKSHGSAPVETPINNMGENLAKADVADDVDTWASIKVGISIDPIVRIRNLPQLHLHFADVFDLRRSVAVYVPSRADAMALERAALRHFSAWKTSAPSGYVSYATGELVCTAPIRWSAGGEQEWLNASVYDELRQFLLFADRRSSRPAISMAEWEIQLEKGVLQ